MGWGNAFDSAWSQASAPARQAAAAVASGTRWVGQQSKAAVAWSKDKAAEAGAWAKQQAARALEAAKGALREGERKLADAGIDLLPGARDTLAAIGDRAKGAYQQVRSLFGAKAPSSPVTDCVPACKAAPDGSLAVPGKGGDCPAVSKAQGAQAARQKAVLSDDPCCQKRRAAGEPTRDIVYVNGIKTDFKAHCATLHAIAEQTCARVIGVYNATDGAGSDAVQTGRDRLLIKAANEGKAAPTQDGRNPAVDTLSDVVVDEVRAGRKPEIWAHSQGGAVASLALYDARLALDAESTGAEEPLAGVRVVSMGSAAPYWPDGPTYEHYVHVNDATPASFGLGQRGDEDPKRAGRGATVVRFSGDPAGAQPFEDRHPKLDWVPAVTANHGVDDSYLRMVKQRRGGCP